MCAPLYCQRRAPVRHGTQRRARRPQPAAPSQRTGRRARATRATARTTAKPWTTAPRKDPLATAVLLVLAALPGRATAAQARGAARAPRQAPPELQPSAPPRSGPLVRPSKDGPPATKDRPLRIKRIVLQGLPPDLRGRAARVLAPLRPHGRLRRAGRRRAARRIRRALLLWLWNHGRPAARVRVTERHPGDKTAFVLLRVTVRPGPRALVGALDVVGPDGPPGPRGSRVPQPDTVVVTPALRLEALRRMPLRSGALYSARAVQQSRQAVADVWGDRGHAFAQVTVLEQPHSSGRYVDVIFQVRPGPRVRVGAITIRGTTDTGRWLVRQALGLRVGDWFHASRLRGAAQRLRATGAFSSVAIRVRPMAGGRARIEVRVAAKRGGRSLLLRQVPAGGKEA